PAFRAGVIEMMQTYQKSPDAVHSGLIAGGEGGKVQQAEQAPAAPQSQTPPRPSGVISGTVLPFPNLWGRVTDWSNKTVYPLVSRLTGVSEGLISDKGTFPAMMYALVSRLTGVSVEIVQDQGILPTLWNWIRRVQITSEGIGVQQTMSISSSNVHQVDPQEITVETLQPFFIGAISTGPRSTYARAKGTVDGNPRLDVWTVGTEGNPEVLILRTRSTGRVTVKIDRNIDLTKRLDVVEAILTGLEQVQEQLAKEGSARQALLLSEETRTRIIQAMPPVRQPVFMVEDGLPAYFVGRPVLERVLTGIEPDLVQDIDGILEDQQGEILLDPTNLAGFTEQAADVIADRIRERLTDPAYSQTDISLFARARAERLTQHFREWLAIYHPVDAPVDPITLAILKAQQTQQNYANWQRVKELLPPGPAVSDPLLSPRVTDILFQQYLRNYLQRTLQNTHTSIDRTLKEKESDVNRLQHTLLRDVRERLKIIDPETVSIDTDELNSLIRFARDLISSPVIIQRNADNTYALSIANHPMGLSVTDSGDTAEWQTYIGDISVRVEQRPRGIFRRRVPTLIVSSGTTHQLISSVDLTPYAGTTSLIQRIWAPLSGILLLITMFGLLQGFIVPSYQPAPQPVTEAQIVRQYTQQPTQQAPPSIVQIPGYFYVIPAEGPQIPVYGLVGEFQTREDVSKFYQTIDGDNAGVTDPEARNAIRAQHLNPNVRYLELVIPRSAYLKFQNNEEQSGVTFEEWIQIHVDILNQTLEESNPSTQTRVQVRRVLVIEDSAVSDFVPSSEITLDQYWRETYGNSIPLDVDMSWAIGDDYRDNGTSLNLMYVSHSADGSRVFTQFVDGSVQVRRKYVLPPRTDSLTGKENVLIDPDLLHEWLHQVLGLPDTYIFDVRGGTFLNTWFYSFTTSELGPFVYTGINPSSYDAMLIERNRNDQIRDPYGVSFDREGYRSLPSTIHISVETNDPTGEPTLAIHAVRFSGGYLDPKNFEKTPDRAVNGNSIDITPSVLDINPSIRSNSILVRISQRGRNDRVVVLPISAFVMSKLAGVEDAQYTIVFTGYDNPGESNLVMYALNSRAEFDDYVAKRQTVGDEMYAYMQVDGTETYYAWYFDDEQKAPHDDSWVGVQKKTPTYLLEPVPEPPEEEITTGKPPTAPAVEPLPLQPETPAEQPAEIPEAQTEEQTNFTAQPVKFMVSSEEFVAPVGIPKNITERQSVASANLKDDGTIELPANDGYLPIPEQIVLEKLIDGLKRTVDTYRKTILSLLVETNERYQITTRDGGRVTKCNIFVSDVTRLLGVEIPHWWEGREMSANRIYTWLHSQFAIDLGWRNEDLTTAGTNAERGIPTVAVDDNGHIAMVIGVDTDGEILVAQARITNGVGIRLSKAFVNPGQVKFFSNSGSYTLIESSPSIEAAAAVLTPLEVAAQNALARL
ncbi:MAG: hypothetical protein WC525_09305, partial [Candidatus Thermoplasmatota archaeon]